MKLFYFTFFLLFPTVVFGHATPTAYTPEASSIVPLDSVGEVRIHFSEPVREESAHVFVFSPDGAKSALKSMVAPEDPRQLFAVVPSSTSGVYTVSWEVVSLVDGHFTKGAFSFFVGATSSAPELYGGSAHAVTEKRKTIQDVLPFLFTARSALWNASRVDASRMISIADLGEDSDAFRLSAFDARGERIVNEVPPLVVLHNAKEGIGPLVVPAKKSGEGEYDIPWALFVPHGEWHIAITWKHAGNYDINTTMSIDYPREIESARTRAGQPPHLSTLGILLIVGILSLPVLLAWYNRYHARKHNTPTSTTNTPITTSE